MIFRKSSENNLKYAYLTGFSNNILPSGLIFLVLSYFFVFMPVFKINSDRANFGFTENPSFIFTSGLSSMSGFLFFIIIFSSIIIAVLTFKFIAYKKTVNVFYSLGIKRAHLFLFRYLAGLTLIMLSVFLPTFFSFILNTIKFGFSQRLFQVFLYYFSGMFSLGFFTYSLSALIFTGVGTVFEGVIFSFVFISFPNLFIKLCDIFEKNFVVGSPVGYSFSKETGVFSISERFAFVNPFSYLLNGFVKYQCADKNGRLIIENLLTDNQNLKSYLYNSPDFKAILLFLMISILLLCLAIFSFKRRKAEIAGFIGKNKINNFIVCFGAAANAFVGINSFFNNLRTINIVLNLIISSLVFVFIYIILLGLILRSKKIFVENIYKMFIGLAICLFLFVFFYSGYFGYMKKLPNKSRIEYVEVSTDFKDYAFNIDYYENGTEPILFGECKEVSYPVGRYRSKSDVDAILRLHNSLIMNGHTLILNKKNNIIKNKKTIKIVYHLKNGKNIKRAYYGANDEQQKLILALEETDYIKGRLTDIFSGKYQLKSSPVKETEDGFDSAGAYQYYKRLLWDNAFSIYFYDKAFNEHKLTLTDEQRKNLVEAIGKDIKAMTAVELYSPEESYGSLCFTEEPVKLTDEYLDELKNRTQVKSDSNFSIRDQIKYNPYFILTDKMKNTISYFNFLGLDLKHFKYNIPDELVMLKLPTNYISKGLKSSAGVQSIYFSFISDYKYDSLNSLEKIDDKNTIKEIIENSTGVNLIERYNGYAVFYRHSSGNVVILYVDGKKLSEKARARVLTDVNPS